MSMRHPAVQSGASCLFLVVTFFTICIITVLLVCLLYFRNTYSSLRRPLMIIAMNVNMLAISQTNELVQGAIKKGGSERAVLLMVLLNKWPALLQTYLCFRTAISDTHMATFPAVMWLHLCAGSPSTSATQPVSPFPILLLSHPPPPPPPPPPPRQFDPPPLPNRGYVESRIGLYFHMQMYTHQLHVQGETQGPWRIRMGKKRRCRMRREGIKRAVS
eukprot:jgi/Botrbrau1/11906/Bobra.0171s0016.1